MIMGSLNMVLNEGTEASSKKDTYKNRYAKVLKGRKYQDLDYWAKRRANHAWWNDRLDEIDDYVEKHPAESIGTAVGTGLGFASGGIPAVIAGGVIGNLGVRAAKAANKRLRKMGI